LAPPPERFEGRALRALDVRFGKRVEDLVEDEGLRGTVPLHSDRDTGVRDLSLADPLRVAAAAVPAREPAVGGEHERAAFWAEHSSEPVALDGRLKTLRPRAGLVAR